jgi:hypothetical protein
MRHEPSSGYDDAMLNYRVSWTIMDSGGAGERIFTSGDQGLHVGPARHFAALPTDRVRT